MPQTRHQQKSHSAARARELLGACLRVQLPALAEFVPLIEFLALAVTSRELSVEATSTPVLRALAARCPVLRTTAVTTRIAESAAPLRELLDIAFLDNGDGFQKDLPPMKYECVVELSLRDGTKIIQCGPMCNWDNNFAWGAAWTKVDIELTDPKNRVTVHEDAIDLWNYDEEITESIANAHEELLAATCPIGYADITIVRGDGRVLRLFEGEIDMIPTGLRVEDWDAGYSESYEISLHSERSCSVTPSGTPSNFERQLSSRASLEAIVCDPQGGRVSYVASCVLLEFENWLRWDGINNFPEPHRIGTHRENVNDQESGPSVLVGGRCGTTDDILYLLDFIGDWR